MFKYFKTDENGVVVAFHETKEKETDKSWIECPVDDFTLIAGKKWDGKEFSKEVVEPEKIISLDDLNKKLDLIIKHLGIKEEEKE